MSKVPHKPTDDSSEPEEIQPKIMTKPLPMILDELEDYIKRVEEAVSAGAGRRPVFPGSRRPG